MKLTGSDLMRLRVKAGLNKSRLAALLGVDRKTIANWESDIGNPGFDQVVRLCVVCNVSALLFFTKLARRKDANTPVDLGGTELEKE